MRKYKFTDVEPYFLEKLKSLRKLLDSGNRFETAILALCYIDALGNLFMKGTGTKQKFLALIFSYGEVDDFRWDKVNLAEFKKVETGENLRQKMCATCYEKVQRYIDQNFCQYDYSGSSECIKKDKCLPEVIVDILKFGNDKACNCNIISEALLKCLYDSTYGGILYSKYRCEGVHKGKFDELWDSLSSRFDGPFYMDIQDSLPDFSIPPEFILKVFEKCLVGLKENNK
ncbi:MAG: hypothetical protein Q8Q08_06705 [Candidatus Omnitrophota bacterium]|nr:hypothetical protein [Candidatus Omnitrophota bacterium]